VVAFRKNQKMELQTLVFFQVVLSVVSSLLSEWKGGQNK